MVNSTNLVGVIDSGTTSTRFVVIDANEGRIISISRRPLQMISPRSGWYEHDAQCTVNSIVECMLERSDLLASLNCIGITNQRESVVAWNAQTGEPIYNAILWMDSRSCVDQLSAADIEVIYHKTKMPPSSYCSASKMKWIVDQNFVDIKDLRFSTIDSWLILKLSHFGIPFDTNCVQHCTDVTNAHRTGLVSLESNSDWDSDLLNIYQIPLHCLGAIQTCQYGSLSEHLFNVPIEAVVGDQHAAMVGLLCSEPNSMGCTLGTGSFLLLNNGSHIPEYTGAFGDALGTIGYQSRDDHQSVCFARELSLSSGASTVNWLISVNLLASAADLDEFELFDPQGVLFVPFLSGSLHPWWQASATGSFVNLKASSTSMHMVSAVMHSIVYSIRFSMEVAQIQPLNISIGGGLGMCDPLVQLLADQLQVTILRHTWSQEATAMGCAMLAFEFVPNGTTVRFEPRIGRPDLYDEWKCLVN